MPRWEPYDLQFPSTTPHGNPFMVDFSADARGPDGLKLTLPGFYDGDHTWQVRFAPPQLGDWQLTTHSPDPMLDGKTAAVTCVPNPDPNNHGGLIVDPDHPYHFVHEDGARHFLSGYECDWLWALPAGQLPQFLDKLRASRFNHILLNAYAHDTRWATGVTSLQDYGPPRIYPWGGSNEAPDFSRLDLPYWQHYDTVIAALADRGITAHVMIKVYNKLVNWPERASPEEDLYFRYLIARYAAFPNVIWDFSKETCNEKNLDYKLGRLKLIRDLDPYRRLVTIHDDGAPYERSEYDAHVDFESDQQHSDWHDVILEHRRRRACPAVNVEYGYEHGPGGIEDKTYGVVQAPEEVLRRAWIIAMAGGYGAYYYTYTAWDVIRPQDTPPGYAYCRHLADFFTDTGYWALEPSDHLVKPGCCLARPAEEYIVYLEESEPFTLEIEGAHRPLPVSWFNPLTGQRLSSEAVENGETTLTPPWTRGPVALHIGQAPAVQPIERLSCTRP